MRLHRLLNKMEAEMLGTCLDWIVLLNVVALKGWLAKRLLTNRSLGARKL